MPPTPRKAAAKSSARQNIASAANERITKAQIDKFLDVALATEIVVTAVCEDCGGTMKAAAPDVKKQLDVLIALLEQAEGRPEQRAAGAATVVIERPAY